MDMNFHPQAPLLGHQQQGHGLPAGVPTMAVIPPMMPPPLMHHQAQLHAPNVPDQQPRPMHAFELHSPSPLRADHQPPVQQVFEPQQQQHQLEQTAAPDQHTENFKKQSLPSESTTERESEPPQDKPKESPPKEQAQASAPPKDQLTAKAGEEDDYQQQVRRRKLEPRGVPWFSMLERLKQYRDRYGSLNVPSTFRQDPKLASWVQYQRYLYNHKRDNIAPERVQALTEIGFEWNVLKPKSGGAKCTWDQMMSRLAKYVEENGTALVPYSYSPDPSLGYWVSKQRKDFKHGQLTQDKIDKLKAVNFVFTPPTGRRHGSRKKLMEGDQQGAGGSSRQAAWDLQFEKLKNFQQIHGPASLHSRSDLVALDRSLATWIKTQRHQYTIKRMSQERVAKLESIGFAWRVGQDWTDYFQRLKDHRERHGDSDSSVIQKDPRLAAWVDSQRVAYQYKELSKERYEKLKSINFSFEIDEGLKALESSAPPVDESWPYQNQVLRTAPKLKVENSMPPLTGGKVDAKEPSHEEMAAHLETQQRAAPTQATAQPTKTDLQIVDGPTNLHEYNIACHLAGLAGTPDAAKATSQEAEKDKTSGGATAGVEGELELDDLGPATMDMDEEPEKDKVVPVLTEGEDEEDKAGKEVDDSANVDTMEVDYEEERNDKPTGVQQAKKAQKSRKRKKEVLEEEDEELLLHEEIVELQEEKVRLQEEKLEVQKEKLHVHRELEKLKARNQELHEAAKEESSKLAALSKKPEEGTENAEGGESSSGKEKKDLEEKLRANDEQLKKQASMIEEQDNRLHQLQQELSALDDNAMSV